MAVVSAPSHRLSLTAVMLLLTVSLSATVTVPAEFREVVSDAAVILRGHVTDARGVVQPARGIETVATVAVDEVIKGDASDFVSVVVPGGTVGRIRSEMAGGPKLRVGERAVLFLKRDRQNLWRPVGLSLGIYPIRTDVATGDALINPPLVAGQTADEGTVVRGDERRKPMAPAEFASLVRLVMAASARGSR